MKNLKIVAYVALALTTFGCVNGQYKPVEKPDNLREVYENTVLQRAVTYKCQNNKKPTITYGFNEQKLPTYASAKINGKYRFMPLNLARTDNVDTVFGAENNYSLMSGSMKLSNYHKLGMTLTNPVNEIVYKNCEVTSVMKLKLKIN